MDLDAARKLKVGDRVVAKHDGESWEIVYHAGDTATVHHKDTPDCIWPILRLDAGGETGRVYYGHWEMAQV